MKKCELCNSAAKLYCESDQACLCWDCDAKVHSANFLVIRHSRILLCHVCQSLTPWHGSGPKFAPTMSVCDDCISKGNRQSGAHSRENDDDRDDVEDDSESGDEEEEEEDDDEENQVVPWTSTTPPPQVSSSSNGSSSS